MRRVARPDQYWFGCPRLRPGSPKASPSATRPWPQVQLYVSSLRRYFSSLPIALVAASAGYLLVVRFMKSGPPSYTDLRLESLGPVTALACLVAFGALYDLFRIRLTPGAANVGFVGTAVILCFIGLAWTGFGSVQSLWLPAGLIGAIFSAPGLSPALRGLFGPSSTTAHRCQFFGIAVVPMTFGAFLAVNEFGAMNGVRLPTVMRLLIFGVLLWKLVEPTLLFRDVEGRLFASPRVDDPYECPVERDALDPIAQQSEMEIRLLLTTPPLIIALTLFGALDVTFVALAAISYGTLVIGTLDIIGLANHTRGLRVFRLLRRQFVFMILVAVAIGSVELVGASFTGANIPDGWIALLSSTNGFFAAAFAGGVWGMLQSMSKSRLLPYWVSRARTMWASAIVCWLVTALMVSATSSSAPFLTGASSYLGRSIALNLASLGGVVVSTIMLAVVYFSRLARLPEECSRCAQVVESSSGALE